MFFLTLWMGEWTRDCDCPISDLQSFYIGGDERRGVTGDAAESSASQPRCSLLGSQYPTIIIKLEISTFLFLERHFFRCTACLFCYINAWINFLIVSAIKVVSLERGQECVNSNFVILCSKIFLNWTDSLRIPSASRISRPQNLKRDETCNETHIMIGNLGTDCN